MASTKNKKTIQIIGGLLLVLLFVFSYSLVKAKTESKETKASEFYISEFNPSQRENSNLVKNVDELKANYFRNQNFEYESRIFEANFSFDALGATWNKDNNSEITVFVRFSKDNKNWEDWQDFGGEWDADNGKETSASANNDSIQTTDLLFFKDAKYFQYKVKFFDEKYTSELESIKFTYIKPEEEKTSFFGFLGIKKAEAVNSPRIISRAEWGANPSYMTWTPEYVNINKLIIHHTASGNNPPDPAAVVRSIYYYHAVSLGWGDIGYNYLVDQHGNLYEGRYGGNGVVGAHAYGQNYGSVGISVIGTYTSVNVTPQAFNGLTSLVAFKTYQNDFSPTWGTVFGHRDFCNNPPGHNCTACPGEVLYSRKGEIISVSQAKVAQYIQADINFLTQNNNILVKSYTVPAIYLWQDGLKKPFADMKSFTILGYNLSQVNYVSIHALLNYEQGETISALLKDINTQTVYLAASNFSSKYLVPSASVFDNYGFSWANIVEKDSTYINSLPTAGELKINFKGILTAGVYQLRSGYKSAYPNPIALESWGYSYDDVIELPQSFVDVFPNSAVLFPIINKQSGAAYLMQNGSKHLISTVSIFYAWGFKWNEMTTLSDAEIDAIPSGPSLSRFAKGSEATIYLIDSGNKYPFLGTEMLARWGKNPAEAFVCSDGLINNLPTSSQVNDLVKSSSSLTVYLVYGGKKYAFDDSKSFVAWNKNWSDIRTYSNNLISEMPNGEDGLYKHIQSLDPALTTIYLVSSGEKKPFSNAPLFVLWGGNFSLVSKLPTGLLNSLTTGSDITLPIKGSGSAVYLMNKGTKSAVPNLEVLSAWGYAINDATILPDKEINAIPNGPALSVVSKANNSNAVYKIEAGKKAPFPSANIFYSWGFSFNQVASLSPELIAIPASENNLSLFAKVQPSDVTIYLLNKENKKAFPNYETFQAFGSDDDISISSYITRLPSEGNVSRVIKSNTDTIYYVTDQTKRPFADWATFVAWGYSLNDVIILSPYTAAAIPTGSPISQLIKGSADTIYYLQNSQKRPIPNLDVLNSYGWTVDFVIVISDVKLSSIPTGPMLLPNVGRAIFTSSSNFRVITTGGQVLHNTPGGQQAQISYYNNLYYVITGYDLAFSWYGSSPLRVEPTTQDSIIEVMSYYDPNWNKTINYNRFRGSMEVVHSTTGTWVVNDLPLNDYVVGIAENSPASDPAEKMKAMAVAARTYGEYYRSRGGKHPGEPFHLKNSRQGNGNDQVYAGYGYEVLAGSYPALARSTGSQVVYYSGSVIVAAYSRGYLGRTRSAMEAWGIDYPYLQSVSDPYASTTLPCGTGGNHCVGLSASGAIGYANNEARTYSWILAHYYSNTSLNNATNANIRIAIYKL